jgi:hypothetical protein
MHGMQSLTVRGLLPKAWVLLPKAWVLLPKAWVGVVLKSCSTAVAGADTLPCLSVIPPCQVGPNRQLGGLCLHR